MDIQADLDPASSTVAQETVQAKNYFTPMHDGLAQDWEGNIWLNPPYSQALITHFAEKMVAEWQSGRVTQAIMLTHNYTDTSFAHTLAGIYVPDTAREKPQRGTVQAAGKDVKNLKVGEQVLFDKYSGTKLRIDDEDCLILKEEDILGVFVKS